MSDEQGYNQNWQSQYQQPAQPAQGQPHTSAGYVFNSATGQWESAGGGHAEQRSGWTGITSSILGVFAGLMMCISFVAVGMVVSGNPQIEHIDDPADYPPEFLLAACGLFLAMGIQLIGLIFGIAGMAMSSSVKGWAIAGSLINVIPMVGMCGLMVVGSMIA